jgi:hypothetical protein
LQPKCDKRAHEYEASRSDSWEHLALVGEAHMKAVWLTKA